MEDTGGFATNVAGNSRFFNSEENTVSVMFVEATPHGELIRLLKETEEKHMVAPDKRIKFVEKCGQKQIDTICISDPFRTNCITYPFTGNTTFLAVFFLNFCKYKASHWQIMCISVISSASWFF